MMKKARALKHYDAGKGVVAAGAVHDVHPELVDQLLASRLIELLPEEAKPEEHFPSLPLIACNEGLPNKEPKRSKNKKG